MKNDLYVNCIGFLFVISTKIYANIKQINREPTTKIMSDIVGTMMILGRLAGCGSRKRKNGGYTFLSCGIFMYTCTYITFVPVLYKQIFCIKVSSRTVNLSRFSSLASGLKLPRSKVGYSKTSLLFIL